MAEDNAKIKEFDDFFTSNYKYLLSFTKSINVRNDYENLLHDCYIKCRGRIALSGYSGQTYMNFVRVAIMNTYKTNYRDTKYTIDFDNYDYSSEIEAKLQEDNQYEVLRQQYDNDIIFINTLAYEYVDKYFTEKENAIFKTYYLLKHKQLNYKQLAEATNYSITSVSNTIKKIKKSLKENLLCYINTGNNKMELEDKIKKVEGILSKDFRHNLGEYKQVYLLVFGKGWSGCSCNLNNLRQSLVEWLNKNKVHLK